MSNQKRKKESGTCPKAGERGGGAALLLGIATMAAVVCAAVCLFLMYFSRNGRTVDESRSWLKRIVVCWITLMLLGAIATYFQGVVAENQYQV